MGAANSYTLRRVKWNVGLGLSFENHNSYSSKSFTLEQSRRRHMTTLN